jgi:hypothetical protein
MAHKKTFPPRAVSRRCEVCGFITAMLTDAEWIGMHSKALTARLACGGRGHLGVRPGQAARMFWMGRAQ